MSEEGAGPTGAAPLAKLVLTLRLARPGQLLFVEQNAPQLRRGLPERLWREGVQRPYLHIDFAQGRLWVRSAGSEAPREEPLPALAATGVLPPYLRALLSDLGAASPYEVIYLDGLESRIDDETEPAPGGELERLNLAREALGALGAVLVFLMPAYVVQLLRTAAVNLWTWRSHHAVLPEPEPVLGEGRDERRARGRIERFNDTPTGDTPETRERRIRISLRLLSEERARGVRLSGPSASLLLAVLPDLVMAGRRVEALKLAEGVLRDEAEDMDPEVRHYLRLSRAEILGQLGRFAEERSALDALLREVPENVGPKFHVRLLYGAGVACVDIVQAEVYLRRAAALCDSLGQPQPVMLLKELGRSLFNQGRIQEAALLLRRALRQAEAESGVDAPVISRIIERLTDVLDVEGRHKEAQHLAARALAIDEKAFGLSHHRYAESLSFVGWYDWLNGDAVLAESRLRQAIDILKATLGDTHPDTGDRIRMLGDLLAGQARYSEAISLLREALATAERSYGPTDLATALELHTLARAYSLAGQPRRAEPLLRRAMRIYLDALGPTHPSVRITRSTLAAVLDALGRPVEANSLRSQG